MCHEAAKNLFFGNRFLFLVINNSCSNAFKNDVRPYMHIFKLDTPDFTAVHNFCDFVNFISEKDTMRIELKGFEGNYRNIILAKEELTSTGN